jgi:hypothetical protein
MDVAIDGIGAEKTAEQKDFGGQEEPHAELARVELLQGRVEVVGQEFRVIMRMIPVAGSVVGVVGGCRHIKIPSSGSVILNQ